MTKTDHKSAFNKSVTGSKFPSVASSPKNVKSPKAPRVSAPKVSSTVNGFHFDTMVQGAVNVQLMPLTKADNITIKLASPSDNKNAAFKQENKNKEKINKMELISNSQSFQCVVYCSITETEVNLKVYLNSSGAGSPNDKPRIENFFQSKPILSLYSDLLMPYNILATPNDALNQLHIQQQHIHSGNTTNILFFCGDPYVRAEWAQFINSPHHNQQTQPHNSSNFNDHISRTPVLFKTQNSLGITTAQLSPVIGTRKPLISFDSPQQQQQFSSAQQLGQSTANNQSNNNQSNNKQDNQVSSNQNYNPSPRSHTIHSPTPPAGTPRSFESPVRNRSISLGADSHNRPPIVLPTSTTKLDPNAANVLHGQGVSSSGNSGDNYGEINNSSGAGVNRHDLLKASLLKANPTVSNDYNTTNNCTEIAVTKAIHSLSVDSGAQLPFGNIKITAPIQSHQTQQSHSGLSQLTEANLLMLGSTSKTTSENNMNIGVSGGFSGGVSVAGSTVANSTLLGSNNVQNSYNYNNTPSVTNTSVHSTAYRTQAAGSFVLPGNGYSQLTVNLPPQQALSSGTATPTTYQVNNYINSPAQSPRYNNTVAADSGGDNRDHSNSCEMNSTQQQQQQAPMSRIEQLREEIEKIKQEINLTELTYQREELQLCANEEASLKDSVNTVYSSLLQQGLLPTELSAEQEKVKVWEKVQRAKNDKKSTQRLQIIEAEMQSMRAEGNDLITKLLQEIKTEEERIKTEKAASAAQQDLQNQQNSNYSTHSNNNSTLNSPTNRLRRMTERTITDTKARFQAQIDQIRQEMIEKEASLKRDTEEKNKEEETKLQDTITAVFDSLLASTELSPTELLSEQDKVHVWENIQRAKLAKSLKQRRKNMNKEINKMLSEGREEVKRLMILQRDTSLLQNQQLLEQMNDPNYAFLETVANSNNVIVYEVDDEVVKSRTYSDLNSVQTLGDKGQVFQIPADSIHNQLSPAVSPVVTTHKGMYGSGAGAGMAGSNSSSVAGGIAFTDSRSRTSSDAVSTSGLGRSRASSNHDNEVTKQMREANRQAQLREILTQQELHEQKVEQDRVNRLTQQQREDEMRLAAVANQMKEQQRTQEELKAEQAAQLAALQKAENDQLIARLKQNIDSLQEQTLLAEKSLLEEEARLCIEESASLTSSVSVVYNSLLTQNLSPEKLLEEQEKVQVWEHIQRRKQQKQTNKRKAQLKTKIVLVKQNATDKIAALTTELNNAINQHYGGATVDSSSSATQQQFTPEPLYNSVDSNFNTYNNTYSNSSYDNSFINYDSNSNDDVGEETEAERKIKDYSRQQFELHSTAQRELFDKQQALLTEIANKKAQMIIEENQRLEAIRLEKEAAIQREIDRVEALRLEAEALRIAEEERLQKIADDERLAAELLEQEKQAEILRIWTEQKEDFEARIRLKLVLKIQRKFRFYQQRKILHKATTALQKVVRGYLIKNRIQKHFRHAIVLIENQSACIITNTLRQYIKHIKMKFRGWELIQELVVASVLEHCLQKREILLLRNKKKAIQKKKDKLRDQMNERESIKARKRQEKEALREAQAEEKRAQERERLAALRKEKEKEELKRAQEQEKIEAAKEKQRLLEFEKSIKRKKKT